jgi:hypothetical protein
LDSAASASNNQGLVRPGDCIDTFRLFLDNVIFDYEDSDGWYFFFVLLDARGALAQGINAHADDNERNALVLWPLQFVAFDMKNSFVEKTAAQLLGWVYNTDTEDILDLLLKIFDNFIDAKERLDGYSMLLSTLWYAYDSVDFFEVLRNILTRGADPHLIGFDDDGYSPQEETPTSLAMYSSWAFVTWRSALLQISTDLEIFVQKELKQSPLKEAGWHENSLLSLFQSRIYPQVRQKLHPRCEMCGKSVTSIVELPWWRWLDSIKEVWLPDKSFPIECKAKYSIES